MTLDPSGFLPKGLYRFHQMVVTEAEGCRLKDEEGNDYLDLTSALGVLPLGYGHPRVLKAITTQAARLLHMCVHVAPHMLYLELAERLQSLILPRTEKKVMLCNSGAEAVENAVKIARYVTGRRAVVAFDGCYHGRTLLCTTLNGRARPYRVGYSPLATDIYHVPYAYCFRCPVGREPSSCSSACIESLDNFFLYRMPPTEVAAVILEPVQGEGGVILPPQEFIKAVHSRCTENGIIFIADEIQTGMGRTGEWLALDRLPIEPDLVLLGKAFGGGLPLSAVMGRAELMDSCPSSSMGSTFGGNPLACAASLETIKVIEEENFLQRVSQMGEVIGRRLQRWKGTFPFVGDVRGEGAMWGIEIVKERGHKRPDPALARRVTALCRQRGVVLVRGGLYGNVVRLLPSFNITWKELQEGLSSIEDALKECLSQP
jgi:4-aminobutyrate aminotransferase/(S)-3-amino-2-methylpropionate transaminase